jgi:hypothetical protein
VTALAAVLLWALLAEGYRWGLWAWLVRRLRSWRAPKTGQLKLVLGFNDQLSWKLEAARRALVTSLGQLDAADTIPTDRAPCRALWTGWRRPDTIPLEPAPQRRFAVRPRVHMTYDVIDTETKDLVEAFTDETVARDFARGLEAAMGGRA